MQIVGKICSICGEQITIAPYAVFCKECRQAFHRNCLSSADICESCGRDIRTDLAEIDQSKKTREYTYVPKWLVWCWMGPAIGIVGIFFLAMGSGMAAMVDARMSAVSSRQKETEEMLQTRAADLQRRRGGLAATAKAMSELEQEERSAYEKMVLEFNDISRQSRNSQVLLIAGRIISTSGGLTGLLVSILAICFGIRQHDSRYILHAVVGAVAVAIVLGLMVLL